MDEQRVVTVDLGDDVHGLDTLMSGYEGITAGYLIASSRPCLIETGTARSAPAVQRALDALGIGRDDLATIAVTHIHLDHAGGVGDLAEAYPNAEIVVHQRGARHLADPAKLMSSATRVFGDLMDTVFGQLRPTDSGRIRAVDEVGSIDLGGGRTLTTYYSPGHAQHHVGLLDSQSGDLYVGDAAGIFIPEIGAIRPSTPPPDFDLSTALASLRHFADLGPQRLLFSHFGPVSHVGTALEEAAEELLSWVDLVKETRTSSLDLDHAVTMLRERTAERYGRLYTDPALDAKFELLNSTAANINGINRWLDQLEAAP
ncbi:MAG TPA: MBL fold metallo-hydrolase [Mycobacteriales bacterium]|nr:MBL fold metallo-hydrolase [Mycobacteriales bacterium]HVX68060.1 MBL fold metallo-hydrolase [Mycobacteriales bacterium]